MHCTFIVCGYSYYVGCCYYCELHRRRSLGWFQGTMLTMPHICYAYYDHDCTCFRFRPPGGLLRAPGSAKNNPWHKICMSDWVQLRCLSGRAKRTASDVCVRFEGWEGGGVRVENALLQVYQELNCDCIVFAAALRCPWPVKTWGEGKTSRAPTRARSSI